MKNNKGFSLVELLITIVIMAVLAAAIAPALIRYIDKSRKADDIASADAMATAFKAALAEEDIYTELWKEVDSYRSSDANACVPLLVCTSADDEWTIYDAASGADLTKFKNLMDIGCAPQDLKFTKDVDPTAGGISNSDYIMGANTDFEPGGWMICINSNNEPCVYVTDGETGSGIQGVSLNPLRCEAYK